MGSDVRLVSVFAAALAVTLFACNSDDSSGSSGAGGGSSSSSAASGDGGAAPCGDTLTHCGAPYHCIYAGVSFFSCAEYDAGDASTYQSLCTDGGGTWASGCCDETGVVGECLASSYCNGMGIGFVTDASQVATAMQSCSDTGGTWQVPSQ